MVYRVYVEKKEGLRHEAGGLLQELRGVLGVKNLEGIRVVNRYDVEMADEELFRRAVRTVFSEPQVDDASTALDCGDAIAFAVEPLPGQFDQRADSASQCIQLMTRGDRPIVRAAKVYLLSGSLTDEDVLKIKKYLINPVECREASMERRCRCSLCMMCPLPLQRWKALSPWTALLWKHSWTSWALQWIWMI
jgi:phosphoribosylformylglycinamidine synthase